MLKQAFMGVAALTAFGISADSTWAQCGCCVVSPSSTVVTLDGSSVASAGGASAPVQSYQRFSYSPSTVPAPTLQSRSASSTLFSTPQVQSYRRYSFQPNAANTTNSPRKHPWEYAKGDPRRYRP